MASKKDIQRQNGHAGLPKRRGAFLISFLTAFLLALLALIVALAMNMTDENRFANALRAHVNYQELGADEASVYSFATETIRYLSGTQTDWNPQITLQGVPAGRFIPQSFREHMAGVRSWVVSARVAVTAGVLLVLALLGRMLLGGRKSGRLSFSPGGYYLGAFLPVGVIGGLGAWAWLDFDSMWAWLHQTFIQDGIFSASEPVMQLFPVELFADYLPTVAADFGVGILFVLALPLCLYPLCRRLAGRSGRSAPSPDSN